MDGALHILLVTCMIVLALCIVACLIRAIIGPRISDRIVAVNMIGTMTIIIIAMISVLLKESYLVDVAMLYAMLSFLAVVVLTKIYMGVYAERQAKKAEQDAAEQPANMQTVSLQAAKIQNTTARMASPQNEKMQAAKIQNTAARTASLQNVKMQTEKIRNTTIQAANLQNIKTQMLPADGRDDAQRGGRNGVD